MLLSTNPRLFTCPYENGEFYSTSRDCLVYYRCVNHMLWSGVCSPWQRFDMHSLSCRRYTDVDCNPEYAGIWRPIYGEGDEETVDQAQGDNGEVVPLAENSDEGGNTENGGETEEEVPNNVEQNEEEDNPNSINEEEDIPNSVNDDETVPETVGEEEQGVPESVGTGDHLESNEAKDSVPNGETGVEKLDQDKESSVENSVDFTEKTLTTPKNAETTTAETETSLEGDINPEARSIKNHMKRSAEGNFKNSENPVPFSTTEFAKQQDSSGWYWYWCGSGRYVYTQKEQDQSEVCQQLEDPEFVQEEGVVSPNSEWAGHTFLGSQVGPV